MEKEGIIITVLLGVIVGLIIAICNNWTEWWQIILCILSATCALFVLLGILWLIACIVILYMAKKWWKKHGDDFIDGFECTLYNTAKSFLRIMCTPFYKLFQWVSIIVSTSFAKRILPCVTSVIKTILSLIECCLFHTLI